MIKVFIEFINGKTDVFYAEGSFESTAQGRIVYWTQDGGKLVSYPVDVIFSIKEQDADT